MEHHLQVTSYSKELTSTLAMVITEERASFCYRRKAAETLRGAQPLGLSVSFLFHMEKEPKECLPDPVHRGKRANPLERRGQDISFSIPGFMKEKFRNMFWSMLLISALSANDSRGFSFRNSLSKLLQSYGDFWIRV